MDEWELTPESEDKKRVELREGQPATQVFFQVGHEEPRTTAHIQFESLRVKELWLLSYAGAVSGALNQMWWGVSAPSCCAMYCAFILSTLGGFCGLNGSGGPKPAAKPEAAAAPVLAAPAAAAPGPACASAWPGKGCTGAVWGHCC
eukprot:TRINITY_DN24616_c0_g2_i2.p2 TRINITY_DN24616_c0_g2~~TRINITY_DN24616_c0_g2_i2.p2  ORF type:complete len:146 (-),score=2.53 TRINITY_DN24616_c0_g2_i2:517-954(-)